MTDDLLYQRGIDYAVREIEAEIEATEGCSPGCCDQPEARRSLERVRNRILASSRPAQKIEAELKYPIFRSEEDREAAIHDA